MVYGKKVRELLTESPWRAVLKTSLSAGSSVFDDVGASCRALFVGKLSHDLMAMITKRVMMDWAVTCETWVLVLPPEAIEGRPQAVEWESGTLALKTWI